MRLGQLGRGGRRRVSYSELGVLAALIAAGLTSFAPGAWGVDGGYGPSGSGGGGGSGTFGNIITAKTVGPDGGSLFGHFQGTTIKIVIPPGAFATEQIVEVVSSIPDCISLKDQAVVIGLAVFATSGKNRQDEFSGDLEAILSNPKITSDSRIVSVDEDRCTALHLPFDSGQVTVPLDTSPAFVLTTSHKPGFDRHNHDGFFQEHQGFLYEHVWFTHEFVPAI